MRMRFFPLFKDEGEVVAYFGQARLIKFLDGKLELRGGSARDHAEAREWMSLFWHEAVFRYVPGNVNIRRPAGTTNRRPVVPDQC